MKKHLGILFIFVFCSILLQAQEQNAANEAYYTGNYSAAIGIYEAEIASGNVNGETYFNLGNAYYQDEQIGLALLNYRRAEQFLPRNNFVAEQIRQVQSERVDGILPESRWTVITANITSEYLTLTETAAITFIIWIAFFITLIIGMRRHGWRITIGLLGSVMLIAVGLLLTRLYVETQESPAIIIVESVQAMSGPADNYLPLFSLYEALDVSILDSREGWVRVVLPDGRQGWVRENSIEYVLQDF